MRYFFAAVQDAKKAAKAILGVFPQAVAAVDHKGRTPMHWAAVIGNSRTLAWLMRFGGRMPFFQS